MLMLMLHGDNEYYLHILFINASESGGTFDFDVSRAE